MRKMRLAILIISLLLPALTNNSYAASGQITSAYTTDINESPKAVFSWNEIPYLFSTFNFWRALEKEVWVSPTLDSYTFTVLDNNRVKDFIHLIRKY